MNTLIAANLIALLIVVSGLCLGFIRYLNAKELQSLVDGAAANEQSYSVVILNGLTGSYSFNID
ncbi:MAG: hypothetical protein Q3976_06085 [Corynebacterium sp.]|nr:hypothetical protein [Corynebacterium sp.]